MFPKVPLAFASHSLRVPSRMRGEKPSKAKMEGNIAKIRTGNILLPFAFAFDVASVQRLAVCNAFVVLGHPMELSHVSFSNMHKILANFCLLAVVGMAQQPPPVISDYTSSTSPSATPAREACPIDPSTTKLDYSSVIASCRKYAVDTGSASSQSHYVRHHQTPMYSPSSSAATGGFDCNSCLCAITTIYLPALIAANVLPSNGGNSGNASSVESAATTVIGACSNAFMVQAMAANVNMNSLTRLATECNLNGNMRVVQNWTLGTRMSETCVNV